MGEIGLSQKKSKGSSKCLFACLCRSSCQRAGQRDLPGRPIGGPVTQQLHGPRAIWLRVMAPGDSGRLTSIVVHSVPLTRGQTRFPSATTRVPICHNQALEFPPVQLPGENLLVEAQHTCNPPHEGKLILQNVCSQFGSVLGRKDPKQLGSWYKKIAQHLSGNSDEVSPPHIAGVGISIK